MREFILFCSFNLAILISISSVVSFSIRHPAYTTSTQASIKNNISEVYFPRRLSHYKTKIDNSTETIILKSVGKTKYDTSQDNENMDSVPFFPRYSLLLQVLIFICCAAGISAILILCCIICLNSLHFSRSTIVLGDDGRVHIRRSNNCRFSFNDAQLQQSTNNESVLTFIPSHHHPWSPSMNNEEAERFTFQLQNDLPPSYDDLPTKEEETISSPPPPYTPSFQKPKEDSS